MISSSTSSQFSHNCIIIVFSYISFSYFICVHSENSICPIDVNFKPCSCNSNDSTIKCVTDNISDITDLFKRLSEVETIVDKIYESLDLQVNGIVEFLAGMLAQVKFRSIQVLQCNSLKRISRFAFISSYQTCNSLTICDTPMIDQNDYFYQKNTFFALANTFINLQYLDIGNLTLLTGDYVFGKNLSSLQTIKLHLSQIHGSPFYHLINLMKIDLSLGDLTFIPNTTFIFSDKRNAYKRKSNLLIDLSQNRLNGESFQVGAFVALNEMSDLFESVNLTLQNQRFNNKIGFLDESVFSQLFTSHKLIWTIDLGKQLNCTDCRSYWLFVILGNFHNRVKDHPLGILMPEQLEKRVIAKCYDGRNSVWEEAKYLFIHSDCTRTKNQSKNQTSNHLMNNTFVNASILNSEQDDKTSSDNDFINRITTLILIVIVFITSILICLFLLKKSWCQRNKRTNKNQKESNLLLDNLPATFSQKKIEILEPINEEQENEDKDSGNASMRYSTSEWLFKQLLFDKSNNEIIEHFYLENKLLPRKCLEIEEDKPIGKGNFGEVYKGKLKDKEGKNSSNEIAIKSFEAKEIDFDNFFREASIMSKFDHPNVLHLIGICLDYEKKILIIVPYMQNGDLKSYIRNENNINPTQPESACKLIDFTLQIAKGMSYLSNHKHVHRDLAARNCLVDINLTVKIADFGLSRNIYMKDYYRSEDCQTLLPMKWMSPESLEHRIYNYKTDVWSFGVLMWELLTFCSIPLYPEVDHFPIWMRWRAMINHLNAGERLTKPIYCPIKLFDIMLRCWREDPNERATFEQLVIEIKQVKQEMETNKNKIVVIGDYV